MGREKQFLERRKCWPIHLACIFCLIWAATAAWAGQSGTGAHVAGVTPRVSHQTFSAPPIPSGAPPIPGYSGYGYHYHYHYGPYYNGYNGGRYPVSGWAYAIPYYYPVDNSAYGYDYVGGGSPDLYSGPPVNPADPSLHMIVEQPPVDPYGPYGAPPDAEAYAAQPSGPIATSPVPPPAEVKPAEPTVLVFRNGHQQEVTNYAIMGDTLYVFDQGRKKIALADLDLPATVKANDDRGMEFKVPAGMMKKKNSTSPQSATPDPKSDDTPSKVAAVMN